MIGTFLVGALALLFPTAQAAICDTRAGADVQCDGIVRSGTIRNNGTNTFQTYTCDETDPGGIVAVHDGPDAIHEFICPSNGDVTLHLDSDCALDVFVLDSCAANDCAYGWDESTDFREVTVDCTVGQRYWLIVEAWYLENGPVLNPCGPVAVFQATYDLYAECNEDCADGQDDDHDGLVDLADPDCCDLDNDNYDALPSINPVCAGTDCNDRDANVRPGATEITGDGIDQNCNGRDQCFRDDDRDGYGSTATIAGDNGLLCSQVAGKSSNSLDCVDTNNQIFPNATEIPADGVDQDCDRVDTCYVDADNDNHGNLAGLTADGTDLTCVDETGVDDTRTDCLDVGAGSNAVFPGAAEICNGIDDDCDGLVDDADTSLTGAPTWYQDIDLDGYAGNASTVAACVRPANFYAAATDCADANPTTRSIYPGAPEIPVDNVDQDCDGRDHCWVDQDGDGVGGPLSAAGDDMTCGNAVGESARGDDCLDVGANAAAVFPGAVEACNGRDDNCDLLVDDADPGRAGGVSWYLDQDGDGFGGAVTVLACVQPPNALPSSTDCLDTGITGPLVYPNAPETPADGVDQDCDGRDHCFIDQDGDRVGGTVTGAGDNLICGDAAGESTRGDDCVDAGAGASAIFPGAVEVCNAVDDDCDLLVDDADPGRTGGNTWFFDADRDGFAGSATTTQSCSQPAGYYAATTDCLDVGPFAPGVYPGAPETAADGLDQDCDAVDDCFVDLDGDGYGTAAAAPGDNLICGDLPGESSFSDDCQDEGGGANAVFPGAVEVCNNLDDDCDTLLDDADDGRVGGVAWFGDQDGDGFAGDALTAVACEPPAGFSGAAEDCLDIGPLAPAFYPGAPEVAADQLDQDCDGVDHCFADLDGDGFGGASTFAGNNLICGDLPGESAVGTDCLDVGDGARGVFPGAPEVCDGVDDDCDLLVDDADPDRQGGSLWYLDADGDGFAGLASTIASCAQQEGYYAEATDCLDVGPDANRFFPGAPEVVADGLDQDCDRADHCYVDRDTDGFGGATSAPGNDLVCGNLAGESTRADDCVDEGVGAAAINPGAAEVCNAVDDDCDLAVDDADSAVVGAPLWFRDQDGDGHAGTGGVISVCAAPAGYFAASTDCDDARPEIEPDALEACNGFDDDCDGLIDDADAIGTTITVWRDADGDGFGDAGSPRDAFSCAPPPGAADNDDDCDDRAATVAPGAPEVPYDLVDQDCDGADLTDVDGDGVDGGGFGDDCVDSVPGIRPGAVELADGVDDDCDGVVDDGTRNADDDGDGVAEEGGDCDDSNQAIFQGGVEVCDGVDQNCDGVLDEGTLCYDDDGDGVTEQDGDCHDGDATVFPGAAEIAGRGVDNNCDGSVAGGDADGDGYLAGIGGDCDDDDPDRRPGAPELGDGLDQDCDGTIDEGTLLVDDDLDGRSEANGDCDDSNPLVNPLAVEIPGNRRDDDCDGTLDEGGIFADDDGDGFTEDAGDCNDADAGVRPYGIERADGIDNDCDGQIDDTVGDIDGDGWAADAGDCDDANGYANPEVDETCDLADNDCDGQVDEGCEGRLDEDDTGIDKDGGGDTGCGCDQQGGLPGAWLAVAVVGAALRRRRGA